MAGHRGSAWRRRVSTPIVITGAGRMFSGGADITEFNTPKSSAEPFLTQVITADRSRPTNPWSLQSTAFRRAAAWNCRLAATTGSPAKGTRLGLPEVTLGILPGAGGTQRMPRLVGVEAALKLIVSGDLVPAEKAHALGFVDEVSEGDVVEAGVAAAERLAASASSGAPGDSTTRSREARGKPEIFERFKKSIARRRAATKHLMPASKALKTRSTCRSRRVSPRSARFSSVASNRSSRRRCAMPSSPSAKPRRSPTCRRTRRSGDRHRRRHRRRHHGRRHRHELRQCGHSGDHGRGRAGKPRPGPWAHRERTTPTPSPRAASPGRHGPAHGPHHRLHRHERSGGRRRGDRGGVREYGR